MWEYVGGGEKVEKVEKIHHFLLQTAPKRVKTTSESTSLGPRNPAGFRMVWRPVLGGNRRGPR